MAPPRTSAPGPRDRDRLVTCLQTVGAAREQMRAERGTGRGFEQLTARGVLLSALEQYAAVISDLGAPLPRQLTAEILLYRQLKDRP